MLYQYWNIDHGSTSLITQQTHLHKHVSNVCLTSTVIRTLWHQHVCIIGGRGEEEGERRESGRGGRGGKEKRGEEEEGCVWGEIQESKLALHLRFIKQKLPHMSNEWSWEDLEQT